MALVWCFFSHSLILVAQDRGKGGERVLCEMRTGAEAFGLSVTQVSFVECIEKVCNTREVSNHIS